MKQAVWHIAKQPQDVDKVNRLPDPEKRRKTRKQELQMRAHTQTYVTDFAVPVDAVSRNFHFVRSVSENFCGCGVYQRSVLPKDFGSNERLPTGETKLEQTRHAQSAGHFAHFIFHRIARGAQRFVDRRHNQILKHFHIIGIDCFQFSAFQPV